MHCTPRSIGGGKVLLGGGYDRPVLCDLERLLGQGQTSQVLPHVGSTSQTFHSGPCHCTWCLFNGSVHAMGEGKFSAGCMPVLLNFGGSEGVTRVDSLSYWLQPTRQLRRKKAEVCKPCPKWI